MTRVPLMNSSTNTKRYATSAPPLNQVEPSTNRQLHPAGPVSVENRESGT